MKIFYLKQIVWYIIGTGIIAVVITLDSDQLMKISWYVYGIGFVLLAFLIVAPESIAPVINGAKSWYKVPGMGSLQPSEFVKVFLILALSRVIVEHHQKHLVKTSKPIYGCCEIGYCDIGPSTCLCNNRI